MKYEEDDISDTSYCRDDNSVFVQQEGGRGHVGISGDRLGMNVEETFDAWEITKADTNLYNESGRGTVFRIAGLYVVWRECIRDHI